MDIILIRNYLPDKQESMLRFADMLQHGFCKAGITVINWGPTVIFGNLAINTSSGIGKWLGYIDKWILFPLVLKIKVNGRKSRSATTRFHICDHSNALYLKYLPVSRSGITCHDVLAIRGALGYADAYCPASGFGKILQNWILQNLSKAHYLACVSQFTYQQLQEIAFDKADTTSKKWVVIHNAFNADFAPMLPEQSIPLLQDAGVDTTVPYLLHVGSNLIRKNRKLLLDMVHLLGNRWNGHICFAGHPVDATLQEHAKQLGLADRIISVVKPNHDTLVALYSCCQAFVFPSLSEGFGWPVIEAQACGTPVIASNIEPMPEVSGGAALHANPMVTQNFAKAFLVLENKLFKKELIQKGFDNAKRFTSENMIQSYINLYQLNINPAYVS